MTLMFSRHHLLIFATLSCVLTGCGGSDSPSAPDLSTPSPTLSPTSTPTANPSTTPTPSPTAAPVTFSTDDARENLRLAKDRALQMIAQLQSSERLILPRQCQGDGVLCFPRAIDEGNIQMSQPSQWTNGFWPGILWKLLSARAEIDSFSESDLSLLSQNALRYSEALFSEAERTNTHDLGFIIYDSLGEALDYETLSSDTRELYDERISRSRVSLATRFSEDVGLLKSWDWTPRFRTAYVENGEERTGNFDLAAPWQYPVIIDNMMNLELLWTSDQTEHQQIALSHAEQTLKNHYYFAAGDTEERWPIAFHVFDYDSRRPGNWQGLGNRSAWARGQGWSLYGFVAMAEFQLSRATANGPDYYAFAQKLADSIEMLLAEDLVPYWDFYAPRTDAADYAADTASTTTRYSRILDLCDYQIASGVLPYSGYMPLQFPSNILAAQSVEELASLKSVAGDDLIVGESVVPCGAEPYALEGRQIPKDSSAAALVAAALYRLTDISDSLEDKAKYRNLADKTMAALSQEFIARQGAASELGFILEHATGNLPGATEIDTSIIYADFYFIEANIRKLKLAAQAQ